MGKRGKESENGRKGTERRPNERDKGEEWERRGEREKGGERLENWRREKHPIRPLKGLHIPANFRFCRK